MIIYTDDTNFDKAVKQTEITLVDFFASWCGPCRMLNTELIKLDNSLPEINVVKVDIDESPAITDQFKIEVVPTMFILKNGEPVKQIQGFKTEADLKNILKEFM